LFADPVTRNKATIGGNIAQASPAADSAPPLLALDAEVVIQGPAGERRLPLSRFFLGVNRTDLAYNELIVALECIPCVNSAFVKVGLRNSMAISIASVAVAVKKDAAGRLEDCRVAFGALASRPVRAFEAEQVLRSQKPRQEVLAQAVVAVTKDISPIEDARTTKEYRQSVAQVIMERALLRAYEAKPILTDCKF
jgi:carbon-monoxide dehydrogenase medium subunit